MKVAQGIVLELGETMYVECIRRVLRKSGYNGRSVKRKPHITAANRAKRLEFARKYENEECSYCNKVLFTNEANVNLFQSDGHIKVWRQPNAEFKKEDVQPTIKHDRQSVLLWDCRRLG
ncbi:hypothetical protein Trydic_g7196 [Trypoxylus dichotomus]